MPWEQFAVLIALAAFAAGAQAQSVTGTILIQRKLTHKKVTADVSVYQRGAAVTLGKDSEEDPLAYEQSRVVIYLEGPVAPEANSPARQPVQPIQPIQVEQRDRRFSPDIAVVPAGSSVSFPNMDPIFHNIFSLSKPKSFDLGSYDKGQTRTVLFPKPGIVEVYCHLHPNMAATIVVTPNRFYAQPDKSGQYRIADVPPGTYTVVAWHRSAGFFRKQITISTGQNVTADFFIPIAADPKEDNRADDLARGTASK